MEFMANATDALVDKPALSKLIENICEVVL
jgi:hypothetical protein